jgi:tetratricopeptide (TPR) repeat protein
LQDDNAWSEALQLWEEVQTDAGTSLSEKARSLYFLGLCHRKLGHVNEASKVWDRAQQNGGEEGQAASLALADLWVSQKMPVPALQAFTAFTRDVNSPGDYQNSLVDLATARTTFENACRSLSEAGDFAHAAQLVRLYDHLALPGKKDELSAQTAEAWGRQLLDQSSVAANSVEAKRREDAAREQFRQAAMAYESAAEAARTTDERNEWLWRAADRYLRGQDRGQALLVLEKFVKQIDVPSGRLGEAWFVMAETHRVQQHVVAAQVAYRRCIEYAGPFAFQARYQLAQAEIEQKNLDDAEAHLQQNLRLIQDADEGTVESEAYEKTLFSLAQLTFQRGEYVQAEQLLTKAVERFPGNPRAQRARFQLARSCRLLADQKGQLFGVNEKVMPEAESRFRKEKTRLLETAAVHFLKIIDDLTLQGRLADEDELLLKQAWFGVADCRFEQGQNDESIRLFQKLAERYPNQVDGLVALSYVCRSYWAKNQPKQVRLVWGQIRVTLNQMNHSAFDGTSDTHTRAWWESWLSLVDSQIKKYEQPNSQQP